MTSFNWGKIGWVSVVGIVLGVILFLVSPEISRLGVIFLFEIFCLFVLWLIDLLLLPQIDLVNEIIKKQNVALVLLILGLLAIPLLAS